MLYKNETLKEISFPLGGIGTGSIGINGIGHLIDWEIFNHPNKGSLNGYTHFAIRAELPDGSSVVKVLQGEWTTNLTGQYEKKMFAGFGYGVASETMAAYPHFKDVIFNGEFPIAKLTFSDAAFPGEVVMTAFNPFIPLNADDSSIPAAFFEIKVNNGPQDVKYTVIFSVKNPHGCSDNSLVECGGYPATMLKPANMEKTDHRYGDLTVALDRKENVIIQQNWYRGMWRDNVSTFWRELEDGKLADRKYPTCGTESDHSSLGCEMQIKGGQTDRCRFVLSWNFPYYTDYLPPLKDESGETVPLINYYTKLFRDSAASCRYSMDRWQELYDKTEEFRASLFGSTVDEAVKDAVSSTLSVLKSPTVLRLEDGTFYAWEGVHELIGSCEGTCTHVWNYAYALCFLFPELERSLRNTELFHDTNEVGKSKFRTRVPLDRPEDDFSFHACVDGQMATVFKVYRDWKISGDNEWLKKVWPALKKTLDYIWSEDNEDRWDYDRDGVLEGRQHHTLDMELFGPSSWLQGLYLAALKAASRMATFMGDDEAAAWYDKLFASGYEWTKENLFNGEYFFHKVDLGAREYTERFDCPAYWNDEKKELKYQIGEGSCIDQLLGQWHAAVCGLGDIFDKEQRKTALKSMYRNNFKNEMREVTNCWRIFAINDEKGAIIVDYPEGTYKPIIPVPYCEECFSGMEYSFAGLLISEGYIEEGLAVVRAVRDRYDGCKRNPWNEIECGSNYARPMSSFALLPIFSGFEFDLPNGCIGFDPVVAGDFQCLWSLGTGWGDYIKTKREQKIVVKEGSLSLSQVRLGKTGKICSAAVDGQPISFDQVGDVVRFAPITVCKELAFSVEG